MNDKKCKVQFCVIEDDNDMTITSKLSDKNDVWNINENLSDEQVHDIKCLVSERADFFSDKPGYTTSIEHVINLDSTTPVSKKPYPIPHHLIDVFNKEVDNMVDLGIIEPSTSPYCSPVVLVKKPDDKWRFCMDFRGVNDVY